MVHRPDHKVVDIFVQQAAAHDLRLVVHSLYCHCVLWQNTSPTLSLFFPHTGLWVILGVNRKWLDDVKCSSEHKIHGSVKYVSIYFLFPKPTIFFSKDSIMNICIFFFFLIPIFALHKNLTINALRQHVMFYCHNEIDTTPTLSRQNNTASFRNWRTRSYGPDTQHPPALRC